MFTRYEAPDLGKNPSMPQDDIFTLADWSVMQSILHDSVSGVKTGRALEYQSLHEKLSRDPEFSRYANAIVSSVTNIRAPVRAAEAMQYERGFQGLHYELIQRAEKARLDVPLATTASSWTGNITRTERLVVLRSLLPQAQDAVAALIADFGDNRGPPLNDEAVETGNEGAIELLRQLHGKLGELIAFVDAGRFDDDLGSGFAADLYRKTKGLVREVKGDPVRYGLAFSVLVLLTACGLPGADGVAGFVLGEERQRARRR